MRAFLAVVLLVPVASYSDDSIVVTPACGQPARLEGHFNAWRHYLVSLKASTADLRGVADALSKKYGFRWEWGPPGVVRVITLLTPDEIAQLRCEPDVGGVAYEQPAIFP